MQKITVTLLILLITSLAYAQNEQTGISEQEIKKLSIDWMTAAMNRDEKALNKIVAKEFKLGGTDIDNSLLPREIWMKNTMENLKIDSISYNKMRIDIIENVAIVQSIFYWSVSFRDNPTKKDTVNLVDTWIKRDQNWQVVSRLVVD